MEWKILNGRSLSNYIFNAFSFILDKNITFFPSFQIHKICLLQCLIFSVNLIINSMKFVEIKSFNIKPIVEF